MTDEYTPGIQQADHIGDLTEEEKQEHGLKEETSDVVEVICRNCGDKNTNCQCVHGERTLELSPIK